MKIKQLKEKTIKGFIDFLPKIGINDIEGLLNALNDKLSKSKGGEVNNKIVVTNRDSNYSTTINPNGTIYIWDKLYNNNILNIEPYGYSNDRGIDITGGRLRLKNIKSINGYGDTTFTAFKVNESGYVYANKFIKNNATNKDILLGDGSTTSKVVSYISTSPQFDAYIVNIVDIDGTHNSFTIPGATKELAGLMTAADKNKIDNYVGTRLNIPNITYVNPEFQEEYTSIGYGGIKYTNGVCTFNVSNGDIDIKSDNIKINGTEISYTRGSNSTTLNQTGLIVDDTSTDSADNSTNSITITSNTIKYKYLKDNSMTDEEDESGDYTYTLPKANGRLLVDSENEANVNYVNSTKDKTLTTGYNGIKYIVVNDEISDVVFDVNDKGVCNAKQFVCLSSLGKASFTTIIDSKSIGIFHDIPFLSKSINIMDNSITFSNTSAGFDDIENSGNTLKTIYSIDNIKKGNFTYSFPGKSGTIELVNEEKDNKLKHIALFDGSHNNKYCSFASFKNLEELIEYVNNNKGKIAEAYTIYNDETNMYCVSLGTDGALVFSQFGLDGVAINYGNLGNDGNNIIDKMIGFSDSGAVFPSNLKLITDSNELYSLNLDKCIELGIVTKDNK